MSVHILHTPMHVTKTEPAEPRWCFACRKRLTGTWSFWICNDPMSYYGPHWAFTCDGCGRDRRAFG